MDERLRPIERLRNKEEIRGATQKRGNAGEYVILYSTPNEFSFSRLGLIVSRKVGNATVRNRIKRYIREVFRQTKNNLLQSVDLVVRAKPGAADASYQDVKDDIARLLIDKKLLHSSPHPLDQSAENNSRSGTTQ